MNRKRIGLLLIAIGSLMGASSSYAGVPPSPGAGVFAIPPSVCEVTRSQDHEKLLISNGYMRFKSGQTGKVTVECPYLGGEIATHGYGPGGFYNARVVLRDPDADSTASYVKIRLVTRELGKVTYSAWFDSSVHGDNTNTGYRVEETGGVIGGFMPLGLQQFATFQVEMFRANTSINPLLIGILPDDASFMEP